MAYVTSSMCTMSRSEAWKTSDDESLERQRALQAVERMCDEIETIIEKSALALQQKRWTNQSKSRSGEKKIVDLHNSSVSDINISSVDLSGCRFPCENQVSSYSDAMIPQSHNNLMLHMPYNCENDNLRSSEMSNCQVVSNQQNIMQIPIIGGNTLNNPDSNSRGSQILPLSWNPSALKSNESTAQYIDLAEGFGQLDTINRNQSILLQNDYNKPDDNHTDNILYNSMQLNCRINSGMNLMQQSTLDMQKAQININKVYPDGLNTIPQMLGNFLPNDVLTPNICSKLEDIFIIKSNPSSEEIDMISLALNIPRNNVVIWFSNRTAANMTYNIS